MPIHNFNLVNFLRIEMNLWLRCNATFIFISKAGSCVKEKLDYDWYTINRLRSQIFMKGANEMDFYLDL